MFVRGPGIVGGTRAPNVGGNVDLAPTFLDLAGITIPPQIDGRSIAPLLRGDVTADGLGDDGVTGWRTAFLVEHYALADWPAGYTPGVTRVNDCPANTYRALRVIDAAKGENLLYVEMTSALLHIRSLSTALCSLWHNVICATAMSQSSVGIVC